MPLNSIRSCGKCNSNDTILVDDDGLQLPSYGSTWVVEQFGDHPVVKSADGSPITVSYDADDNCWVIDFPTTQQGGNLVGDGDQIIFSESKDCGVQLNGAGGCSVPSTVDGGLKVTQVTGNEFKVELCFDSVNPPSGWHVNSSGCIEDGPAV